ncbi:MAG: FAD-binding oxidoreductase [Anaerolineae bacterium]|nr:FAD-binding oxidoreductase [Anaerolineae bacterium]
MSTILDAYDIAVVGGGLAGALVARRLADAERRVVVLESRQKSGGMAAHIVGLALIGTPEPYRVLWERLGEETARRIWDLTQENADLLKRTLLTCGQKFDIVGSARLTDRASEVEHWQESLNLLESDGYDVSLEDAADWGYMAALHTQTDVVFAPMPLLDTLLDHPNITLETEAEVQAIKPNAATASDGAPLLAIWAHKHYLWARSVVATGGAFAAQFVPEVRDLLRPLYLCTADLQKPFSLSLPLVLEQGQVVVAEQGNTWRMVASGDTESGALALIAKAAQAICPDAATVTRHSSWVAQSRDGFPFVGGLRHCPGGYVLNGLGAWGLSWVFVAAECLARQILEGDSLPDTLALTRFEPE